MNTNWVRMLSNRNFTIVYKLWTCYAQMFYYYAEFLFIFCKTVTLKNDSVCVMFLEKILLHTHAKYVINFDDVFFCKCGLHVFPFFTVDCVTFVTQCP